ncbi:Ig-like domain-containing protein, partial [Lactiplantibacillus sp. DA1]|uniref:Ig-like domain-containing protein n=1 Tax=Lactiplantibacillus sp. DA1 TaxID=3079857 RepID=UPI00292A63BD
MHNRWQLFLLVLTGFLLLMLAPPIISQARDVIEATGNDVNSVVIKDSKGNVISHEAQLPENDNYTVNYKWRIPNSVKITAGDTMTFHVPENVQIPTNEAFPMIGTIAGTIGNFFIAAGSHTGIVTFNKVYQYSTNRSGYVNLDVKGTMPSHPGNQVPISLTKYAAWENEADPSHINWTVHVSSNGNQLVDPTFADTLGIGQTFVTGSAVLHDANGNSIPVITTATSNQLSFSATGTYTSSLTLTYKTEISHSADTTTFTNNVDYTDKNNNQGSATANISRPETTAPETPSVTNPENPDEDETPNVTEPEQPSHPEPEQPSTTIPEQPSHPEPEQPSTTIPEQPSHPEPEQPSTTIPEQPSHPEPEQPSTTTPEQPSHPEPE